MREKGNSGIGAVKRALPAETSYGQIKVVATLMQRQLLWFAEPLPAAAATGTTPAAGLQSPGNGGFAEVKPCADQATHV